jgi:hypothetical protein
VNFPKNAGQARVWAYNPEKTLLAHCHKIYNDQKEGQIYFNRRRRHLQNIPSVVGMYYKIHNSFNKACALVAATLILPALAYADHNSGKGNKGDNDGQRWAEKDEHRDQNKPIPSVPEGGPGIILLVATIGAVVLFSKRQLRAKA